MKSLLTWSAGMVAHLENESVDHMKGNAPVPLWVRPEPRRPGKDYRSPVIADVRRRSHRISTPLYRSAHRPSNRLPAPKWFDTPPVLHPEPVSPIRQSLIYLDCHIKVQHKLIPVQVT